MLQLDEQTLVTEYEPYDLEGLIGSEWIITKLRSFGTGALHSKPEHRLGMTLRWAIVWGAVRGSSVRA